MIERIKIACITTGMGSILLTQLQPKNNVFTLNPMAFF